MVEAGLVLSRFLHYSASLILFGVSLFPLYTYPGRAGKPPARIRRWQQVTALTAALCALFSGSLWFLCVAADMTGTLRGAVDPDALWSVLSETSFGTVWLARLLVMTLLVGVIAARVTLTTHHRDWLTPAFSAGLLASLAAAGHTQMHDGIDRIIYLSADGLHLLAAGAWLGGLLLLFYLVGAATRTASPDLGSEAINAAARFSGMGYIAVSTIISSGLVNAWFQVGPFTNLTGTPYGQLLLVKLCLFGGMLALAAVNRFWIVPALSRDIKFGEPRAMLLRLRHHVLGEQVLGLFIILTISVLGLMQPAINQSQ
jgi:putative copper resistance protein D